jgi:methyl-accepting chemotaxis protein
MLRALIIFAAVTLAAPAFATDTTPLAGPWAYRWGDVPAPLGNQALPADGWTAIEPLKPVPGQSADHILWIRIPLPRGDWQDPAVLFWSVGGPFEAYSGGRLVQGSGAVRAEGEEPVEMTWHSLPVSATDLGGELVLRVKAVMPPFGVGRGAYIGSRASLNSLALSTGIGSFIVGLLLLFAALLSFAVWVPRRTDAALASFAAFALVSGVVVLSLSEVTPLLRGSRLISAAMWPAVCAFGPLFGLCLATTLPSIRSPRAILVLRGIAVVSGIAVLFTVLNLPGVTAARNVGVLIDLAVELSCLFLCVRAALQGDQEARVLAVGVGILLLTSVWDSLPIMGLRASSSTLTPFGYLGLIVAFGVVIARRSSQVVDTLAARTRHLEERQQEVVAYSQRLEASAAELADVVDALRRASDAQTNGVTRQAASVQETQVTAEEIQRTSALAAEKANRLLQAAMEADAAGKTGEAAVAQSLGGLEEIGVEVGEMARRIAIAGTRAREIAGIVASVKDLADQSNMLALNAAIEAVRSGEAGRGFSLVAREVRRLADESLRATARIKEVLSGLSEAIAGAVAISESGEKRVATSLAQVRASGDQLQRLSGIAQQTNGHVRQISSAVTQQNAGVTQIVAAVEELSRQMQETLDRARDGDGIALRVQEIVASMRAGAGAIAAATPGSEKAAA